MAFCNPEAVSLNAASYPPPILRVMGRRFEPAWRDSPFEVHKELGNWPIQPQIVYWHGTAKTLILINWEISGNSENPESY